MGGKEGGFMSDGDEMAKFTPADYEYSTLMRLLGVSVSKHLLDEHFTLVWANEFYYKLIGWPKDEYEELFHNRPDLYYENDKSDWELLTRTVIEAVREGKGGYQIISKMRRKNGDHIWVQFSTQFADEYIDGYQVAYTVLTDIDDIMRMQKEQTVTYESIPGFVTKYRIEETDGQLDFVLLESNSRFKEYFREENSDEGSPLYYKNLRDNMEVLDEQKEKVLAGEPLHFTMHVESRIGQELWLQVNATCVDWKKGCPVYLVIFLDITDVTELRRMQKKLTLQAEALKDALTVAEHANQAKTNFLSRMSHEIRTPMNAIIGMTAIAAAHIEERSRVENCLEKISHSSKHLMSLINDILDMAKIDEGKVKLNKEPFDLAEVIESITSIIYPQAEEKGLDFKVPLTDITDTLMIGDSLRLNQILLNLLSNALKFTPKEGRIQLEIRQLQRTDTKVRLRFTVSDTGIGMSKEFLKNIFLPFEQENNGLSPRTGGTGLGMAITKNLVTLMDGTISVKSEPQKGTVFETELEFGIDSRGKTAFLKKEAEFESLKVLIADDDRDSCLHTSLLLKNMGIISDFALSGKECVEKVKAVHQTGEDYDVCLVDFKMPDIDGIEVTRRIRELVGPYTTIIIITAYDWGNIEERARDAGANAFLGKPVFASVLYNTLLSATGIEQPVKTAAKGMKKWCQVLAGRHILLAEDNEINQEIAQEMLEMAGMTADCAENGKEAVDLFVNNETFYDLILMDIQMPVMDGYEAAETIRRSSHPRAAKVPIIAMTADAFRDDVVHALKAGMNGHLSKPIDSELFFRTIAENIMKIKQ